MRTSIYSRHRFHPDVIKRVVWLYFQFNLTFRDIEELMIERGVDVSYETIRRWIDKFGSTYAKRIKRRSEFTFPVWHLDEIYTKINGEMVYIWRAVYDEDTVLAVVVQRQRNTKAALRLLRKLMKNQGIKPKKVVTDRLASYGSALKVLGLKDLQDLRGRRNNRAECSHVPIRRRERKSQKFRSVGNAQKLLSAQSQIYTISSTIDATSSQETRSGNSDIKPTWNGN